MHNLHLAFSWRYFSHRILFMLEVAKRVFPILWFYWFQPDLTQNQAKKISSSSCQFPTIDTLSGLAAVLAAVLGHKAHGRFLKAAESEDVLKVPIGAGWKFHTDSECSLGDLILYRFSPFKEQPCAQVHVSGPSIPSTVLSKALLCALYLWQGLRPADATCPKVVRVEDLAYRH